MKLWGAVAVAVLLGLSACKDKTATKTPAPAPTPAQTKCKEDSDCVLSCAKRDSCCNAPCCETVILASEYQAIETYNQSHCPKNPQCPTVGPDHRALVRYQAAAIRRRRPRCGRCPRRSAAASRHTMPVRAPRSGRRRGRPMRRSARTPRLDRALRRSRPSRCGWRRHLRGIRVWRGPTIRDRRGATTPRRDGRRRNAAPSVVDRSDRCRV